MAWDLTVGGVSKKAYVARGGVQITHVLNERGRATVTFLPGYVPNKFDEVVVYAQDGVTPLFGGLVLVRQSDGTFPQSDRTLTRVECTDYMAYLDWAVTSREYAAATDLKSVLTDLVADAGNGVTLHAGQVVGPALSAFSFGADTFVSEALRQVVGRSAGYYAAMSALKVLRAQVIGTDAAPYALTDASPHCTRLLWQDSAKLDATKVVLRCGPSSGSVVYVGTRTTTAATSYQFDLRGASDPWNVQIGAAYYSVTPPGGGGEFIWTHDTYTLSEGSRTFAGIGGAGQTITIMYWLNYPFEVVEDSGASPARVHRASAPTILDVPAALERAAELLAAVDQSPREVVFESLDHGWAPGQLLTVALTSRISSTFYVTSVTLSLVNSTHWRYRVEATESEAGQGSYLEDWRQMLGGASGAGAIVASGGGAAAGTAGPVYLGGSSSSMRAPNPAAWLPVPDYVPYTSQATYTGRVRARLRAKNATITVQARLYDETAAASVATSSVVTSTAAVEVTFVATITSGHTYRVEILNGTAGEPVFCDSAQLEAV